MAWQNEPNKKLFKDDAYFEHAVGLRHFETASHDYGAAYADWTLNPTEQFATVLFVSNASQAANIVALPKKGKVFIVVNAAGYAITIKASGQSGVSVTNATIVMVMGNTTGTDFSTVTTTTGTISGSTINNTTIGATTPSTGAFTTLTANNSVTLSPVSHPVAISPTGTGTVAISPVGALTINPTAASAMDNVVIGGNTPLAGTFTALTATSLVGPVPVAGGATKTLTAANAGETILLNTAAGSVVTLPAATGTGNVFKFAVTVSATSAAHKILAASASDYIIGNVTGENAGTPKGFTSPLATNHSLQMPYSGTQPSGGIAGDWFELQDVATNLWMCKGMFSAGTTPTTPFNSATS